MTNRIRRLVREGRRDFAGTLRILPAHHVHIGKNGCVGVIPGKWHKAEAMRREAHGA